MKCSRFLPVCLVVLVLVLGYFARKQPPDSSSRPQTATADPSALPKPAPAPADQRKSASGPANNAGFDHRAPNVDGEKQRQLSRESRRKAAERLQAMVPGTRVDFDDQLGSPKFVASTSRFLTGADGEGGAVPPVRAAEFAKDDADRAVKAFLAEHAEMFGHGPQVLADSTKARDYVTPHNGLRTTVWQQTLDGIRVFESTLQTHVTNSGALVNVASRLVPNPRAAAEAGTPNAVEILAKPPIDAPKAISAAAATLGENVPAERVVASAQPQGASHKQPFRAPALLDLAAEYTWLPLDEDTMRLCWEVIFISKQRGEMFRTLVDAGTGQALVQQRLTEYISPASYRVFTSDSPTPMSPGHPTPLTTQPAVSSRQLLTLDALNTTASPNGWIDDGVVETRGNNVDAHTDTNADNVADTPRPQAAGAGRVFDPALDLANAPGTYRDAAVVNLFYWNNLIHDRYYALGFTEGAGNFQNNNFGRGGAGNDAVQADAQDGSGTNNANFSTPGDGSPGRMQMYVFTGPTPDRDGDFDQEIIIHEYTHGLSNRLVGGGVGMSASQSRGMGEGWSDFYGLCLLSDPADDVNGTYAAGAYASYQLSGLTQNYYYGIRRYPYTTDLAKNPLTFKDIDPAQASAHSGVPISPLGGGSSASEVHNQGEVWCVTLWDARANLIAKHGAAAGNDLILKLVTDGMKLAPANPNFLQARDGILQAEMVYSAGANRGELWSAFAKRGMGANATSPSSSTTTGLVENYDIPDSLGVSPNLAVTPTGTIGGPFIPASTDYTLANSGAAPFSWTAIGDQPWLDLSSAGGTLAAGANIVVTASLNSAANGLTAGTYTATITFRNTTSGLAQQRTVRLTIEPFSEVLFTEGFEAGTLGPQWTITGTGPHRTQVTTANVPRTGARHLTMDSSIDVTYARNEATLTLDLSGRKDLTLKFWVKMFGDEPEGPPPAPFPSTGADFDGVAISADGGVNWYEIQPLRSIGAAYQQLSVDLDAALAARGLTYSNNFKIRFNHYDNYTIPTDGFAFDDISITRIFSQSLALVLPPTFTENGAPATATLTVTPAPVSNLTVNLASSLPGQLSVPASVIVPAGQASVTFPVTPADDTLLNGTRAVTITATATTYPNGTSTTELRDNETATITLTLPTSISEGAADLAGSVTLSAPADADVKVSLASDDTSELAPPAFVLIPAGQNSAPFHITVLDDGEIDGTRVAMITASVANWTTGTAAVSVLDNETSALSLTLPATAREGDTPRTGTARISGTLTNPLTVNLSSNDTSEATVPAAVTIPAGQTSVNFAITIVDDTEADGGQSATISATATGFTPASGTFAIADNDAHHLTVANIPGTVLRSAAVSVSITARDVNDAVISNYNQPVSLTAAAGNGANVPVTPATASVFTNGVATLNVTFGAYGTGVVLTAADAGGHAGASNAFDVTYGPAAAFMWNPIPVAQFVDAPFPVTLKAIDAVGNSVPDFTGTASLDVPLNGNPEILTWTAFADISTGGEYQQTKAAITAHFPNFIETSTNTTDPAILAGLLSGKKVFLIVEQESSSATTLGSIGSSWTTVLNNFVTSGGTVIACSNIASEHLLLTNSGLLNLAPVSTPTSASVTKAADTPLNAGVAVPFTGSYLHTYTTTNGVVSLQTSATEAVVISREIGAGRVVMIGTDFYTIGTGMDRVIANAVSLAAPPAGSMPVTPPITASFVGGEWTGAVSIPYSATGIKLRATSGAFSAQSNAFSVVAASVPATTADVLREDFESGTLNPAIWTVTGTGGYHTIATNLNGPHAGSWHLTMDEATDSGANARNEATLTVNLAGRTGVRLTFWAKMFDDEANGPPAAPFTGGADFDGVAMSVDGNTWWEIQALRSPTLTNSWAQFTVDLDAAIATRGIAFTGAFKIRFNQFDNYRITTDGIAIDDIAITANAVPSALTVSLPAQATEGAGILSGTVSITPPPSADLVVNLLSKSASKVTVPATTTILAGQTSASFPLTVLDDLFVDGTKTVVITASSIGNAETGASMQVIDNDGGVFSLTAPATLTEGAMGATATLSLSTPPLVPLSVALVSSNSAALQLPPSINVARGQTSVVIPLTVPENNRIEGTQSVVLAATSAGWTTGSANTQVLDNENAVLTITIPSTVREGDAPKNGIVSISGILASDLPVALSSSDATAASVPGTVAILAGQTSASFQLAVADDTAADGHQPFTITASATGFTTASASGVTRDNEAHHFNFAPIASPQLANGPVPAIISARDPQDGIITDYAGTISLSATSDSGARTITPAAANAFVNGIWNGTVQINGPATNVLISATDGFGHNGSSNPFTLVVGTIDRFVWDPIPATQTVDVPFNVKVRAIDAAGSTVTGFNGVANLTALVPAAGATIGTGSTTVWPTLNSYYQDARSNSLYTAAELGGASKILGVSLNVTSASYSEVLTNLTIRLKHTNLSNLSGVSSWDNVGWTQVYRASPTLPSSGWVTFNFTTPFDYNGTSNLLIDISYDRSTTNYSDVYVQGTSTSAPCTVYGGSQSANGDPLTWSTSPYPSYYYQRADIRLSTQVPVPIRPATTSAFSSGEWMGQVSVPVTGNALNLRAQAGTATGLSNTITVGEPALPPTGGATVLKEDFESGALNPSLWTITGTGGFHTIASNINGPHAGGWHMTMDLASGSVARNEATLRANLAGRTHVRLTFWAKIFGDEPNGPPTAPFIGGADFDGVAMSADGNTWWEIQSLRSPVVSGNWAQFTVDLDAAIAGRAISYNNNFRIRFNQYDDFAIPTDGIAIDDIQITADPIAGFAFSGPAQVVEGSGSMNATVTLDAIAATDTVITLASSAASKITVPASVTIPAGQKSATFAFAVLDDTIVDGDRAVAIIGTLGAQGIAHLVTVADNDVLPISVSAPASMAEGATGQTGTITIGAGASGPVNVSLTSSDATAFTVPDKVTLQPGQTTATFPITPVNDTLIDGTQTATLTAHVNGWSDATTTIQVTDNETRTLALYAPSSLYEGNTSSGSVYLNGTLTTPLVVNLASSNPQQITVPATITIPAGQTNASFVATAVDDTLMDGSQSVTITASAATFTSGTGTTTAYDNDLHHFTIASISGQVRGRPFNVSIWAKDINDSTIGTFTGSISLDASASGTPVPITPATATLSSGSASVAVTVNALGNAVVLRAYDAAGHSGLSNSFNVTAGTVDRFAWGTVPAAVTPNVPFATTLTAQDAYGNVVTTYNGSASLSAAPAQRIIGTATTTASEFLYTGAHEARAQFIYLASEVGPAGTITGLAFEVTSLPSIPLTRFTARVKPTPLTSPSGWESTGWTTVYQSNLTISRPGWIYLQFATPFAHNGTSNLMVDFSFDNDTLGASTYVRVTNTGTSRTAYNYSYGSAGDPLLWSGTTPPTNVSQNVPNLRLRVQPTIPVTPNSVTLSGGIWSGQLSVNGLGNGLALYADSADGLSGTSSVFDSNAVAALGVSPAGSSATTGDRGGPFTPLTHTFTISNAGSGSMTWQAAANVPWVSLSTPNSGPIGPGGSATVTATLDAQALQALPAGNVSATLTFTNLTNGIGDTTRAITVTALPRAELEVTGNGGNYTVRNIGDANLNWTLGALPPWLTSNTTGGTLAIGATASLTLGTNGMTAQLTPGHYAHSIAVTNTTNGRGNTSVTIIHESCPLPIMTAEPAFTGGDTNAVTWSGFSGADAYEAQAAQDGTFSGAVGSGWIPASTHTFTSLASGQAYHFRARGRMPASVSNAWGQSRPSELASGALANVAADSAGIVLTAGSGSPIAGRITNSSFESEVTSETGAITGWTRNSAVASKRGAQSHNSIYTTTSPIPTQGTNYLILYTYASAAHTAGDYISVSTTVDFTGSTSLQFDNRNAYAPGNTWANAVRAEVRIDGALAWSNAANATNLNQTINTTSLQGTHTLELREQVVTSFTSSAQWVTFDNLRLNAAAGYMASGSLVSASITPTATRWGQLLYSADTPAGTALTVDILDTSNAVLATNVANAADLAGIPAVAGKSAIRLRANLSTTNTGITPRLRNWGVTWATSANTTIVGNWSNSVTSTQDGAAPTLTRDTAETSASAILVPRGGAFDGLAGVAAVSVNGKPVTTSNGFATWTAPPMLLKTGTNKLAVVASDNAQPPNVRAEEWVVEFGGTVPSDADGDGLPNDWEEAHGLNGADASFVDGAHGDIDRDGLPNLLEYAFDTDPNAMTQTGLPFAEAKLNPADGKTYLEFIYHRRVGAIGLTYNVETTSNTRDWTTGVNAYEEISVTPHASNIRLETVRLRIIPAIGAPGGEHQFGRVKVVAP